MASGSSDSRLHGKTSLIYEFTPHDFGLLNVIEGEHYTNFTGGQYRVTTPKESVVLYRRYGGNAGEDGQYWSFEPRDGKEALRWDAAVLSQWNSLDKSAQLIVPRGVYLYEGRVSKQAHYLGGGEQVFIPRNIVEKLVKIQPHYIAQNRLDENYVKRQIDEINKAQTRMIDNYHKRLNDRLKEMAFKRGSELRNLPAAVRDAIRGSGNNVKTEEEIKTGRYVVHRDSIPIFGKGRKNIEVSVRIEFSHTTTSTSQAGRTTIVTTTRHYNRITEIKESYS